MIAVLLSCCLAVVPPQIEPSDLGAQGIRQAVDEGTGLPAGDKELLATTFKYWANQAGVPMLSGTPFRQPFARYRPEEESPRIVVPVPPKTQGVRLWLRVVITVAGVYGLFLVIRGLYLMEEFDEPPEPRKTSPIEEEQKQKEPLGVG